LQRAAGRGDKDNVPARQYKGLYIMAGNTRGKLKEQLEGIHRNCEWIQVHIDKSLILIKEHNPKLTESIAALGKITTKLDGFTQDIYAQI